jgi:foldase protein PrsA
LKNSRRGVLVAALIIVISLSGCGVIRKDPEVEKNSPVAEVNGNVITKEEFNRNLELYKSSYEKQFGKEIWKQDIEGKKFIDVIKDQVVEKLILDRLVIEEARKQGIEVTQQEIDGEVEGLKAYLGGDDKFQEFLNSQSMTEEQLAEQIERDLLITKYRDKITEDVEVTADQVRQYYDNNTKEFKDDKIQASHILLDTREEAEEVLRKINEGGDFGELAAEYSVEPGAKTSKGALGYFGYGEMIKEFEDAAFSLEKGEVSGIVETSFGYHIIKVTDKQIVDPTPFEEVRQSIESSLLYKAKEEKYNQVVNGLRDKAQIKTYPKNM